MGEQKGYKDRALLLALIDVIVLSFGHACNNIYIISIALAGFAAIILLSPHRYFLPLILFYLPWATIMKLDPSSFTLYSLIIPIFFICLFIPSRIKKVSFSLYDILLTIIILLWTFTAKIMFGNTFELSYFLFVGMIIFIPTYLRNFRTEISFVKCSNFLAIGTLAACLLAEVLMKFPHMIKYIDVYIWEQAGLVRLSGFCGDANFYSVHILVAITGLLINIIRQKEKEVVFSLVVVFALIFFGLKSVSKMFLFALIIIAAVWIIALFRIRGMFATKKSIGLGIVIGIMFIMISGLFKNEINYYSVRFSMVEDTQSLTTGRSDIYSMYLSYLFNNPLALLIGQGCTDRFPSFGRAAHNTLLQIVYQFGIIGVPLIVGWLKRLGKSFSFKSGLGLCKPSKYLIIMFAIACFTPWLALDVLFFDEFFYISTLFFIGRNYIGFSELAGKEELHESGC